MLADIDSLKFSGLDSMYSRNALNDVNSNFLGIQTVYGYYRDTVAKYAPAADSLYRARMDSASANLPITANGFYSLIAHNKAWYESTYLYPLDSALAQVARVVATADSINNKPQ